MPFKRIGTYLLSKDWTITPQITSELIRITHFSTPKDEYLKGVVSLAFREDGINLLSPKRLSYRQEKDLFEFDIPRGVEEWSIAFRRLDDSQIPWRIQVEVFEGYIVQENLAEKITEKVIEAMSNIYSRGNDANLVPNSGSKNLDAGVVGTLVKANDDRVFLTIRVGGEGIVLYANKDEAGVPSEVIEELAPGEVYNLPVSGGTYKGDIFVVAEEKTTVKFTEFTT